MDKEWIKLPRYSSEYIDGVEFFLNYAYTNGKLQGGEILCPYAKCHNTCWEVRAIIDVAEDSELNKGLNDDAKKFYNLIEEAQQELYPGCKNFSTLSFTIRLYLLKCLHGWSNASFTSLLGLLREAMPHLNIPDSFYKTRGMIKDLGLDYEKIDACPNDCMLYWKDHKNDFSCHVCGASRYTKSSSENDENKNAHKVPAKVLRYFPLIPRLQRLFMCSKTASSLRWHEEERSKDGKLRHPADGEAWKDFDKRHPDFAIDSRNIRLGLASDGFNPFRSMNLSHSTWPMVQIPYNFPPLWCMKAEYSILSLIIPGPKSPGNDIDVYLQPLVDDLKVLWESGVETCDASKNQTFQMRAALMWTINDFPAYAMLSGWSTKGKLTCPCFNHETNSAYLMHSRKMCYMDHRVFLPMEHEYISNAKAFNGRKEFRAPSHLLEEGKTKDHERARFDLQEMGIRNKLHSKETNDGKNVYMYAKACFSMTPNEKSIFCAVLKDTKIPYGCASNISRCVNVAERKVSVYKSHDAHFMLHYLLQVADLDILQSEIAETLCQFETIFPPSFFDVM
ncbi:PREDICTED: uncharacterized protein LOC109337591, partial [Lupinus angustifolius]|uniref:uncharacterized protein LOC109337591 n=1 Tax=Lupinus angustifolius TaxID=3871 RepID=UPI00092F7988